MTVDAGVNPSGEPAVQSERPGAALPANDRDKADQQRQQQHQQGPAAPAPEGQQSEEEEQRPVAPGSRSSLCRICRASSWTKEPLISPCRCKGTQAHVHLSCLERWLNQSCRNYCELCNFRYNALETPRYGWFESLRIWVNHPRNRQHIRTDFLIFALLTVFTAGLSSVCLLGTHHFVLEGTRVGFSETWTRVAIAVFMAIAILGYSAWVYLLIKITPLFCVHETITKVFMHTESSTSSNKPYDISNVVHQYAFFQVRKKSISRVK
ncbi:E3 ubiquitin-protein ligase MARCH1-like isoform X2 [Nasonia vitripennis]|uniref:RING-CH-type domain-containing protein n=1 Tax=Nasonia vitripennis TaxID=7425 RepID=A0A7M7Q212_NASVI|nr:E3 ubiquitin-protein ligase MARCH1-like isoform X2 [Nasonia vitripennis]